MQTTLIMLPNPILVSDEKDSGKVAWCPINNRLQFFASHPRYEEWGLEILAGIEGLPILDLSAIAEKIGWVDVEKLAQKNSELEYPFEDYRGKTKGVDDDGTGQALRGANLVGFENGFKATQSLNEKKFSQDDIRNAIIFGVNTKHTTLTPKGIELESEDFIQSLSKPKEYNVDYIQEGSTIKVTKIL